MQDLGVYPLSNSPLVEGNPYLICLILILFYTFFPFPFRMEGKTLAPVREDTRRLFIPHQNVVITDRKCIRQERE